MSEVALRWRWKATLLVLLAAVPAVAGAAPPKKAKPAAVAATSAPAPKYPPRMADFPCANGIPTAAAPTRRAGGAIDVVRSKALDRFSIRGRDGVFVCRSPTMAQAAAKATGAAGSGLAIAAFAEARGETSPRLLSMRETEVKLQRVVDRLAAAWPYPNAPKAVVRLAAKSQFNAHAHADNVIVVDVGVFAAPQGMSQSDLTDNDLYWLMGHEYAHIALNHATQAQAEARSMAATKGLASVYMQGAKANAAFQYAQGKSGVTGDMQEQIREARTAQSQLQFILTSVVYPAWGRVNEDQADVAGFDIAAALGYYPGFNLAADRFALSEADMEARLAVMQARVSEQVKPIIEDPRFSNALQQGQQGAAFDTLGEGVKKGVYTSLRDVMTGYFSRDHRSAKARREGLSDYRKEAYDQSGLKITPAAYLDETKSITQSAEMKDALIATTSVEAAEDEMLKGDAKAAQRKIAPALASRFRGESLVLLTAGRAAEGAGDRKSAIGYLEKARIAPTISPEAYSMLARLYTRGGELPAAKSVVAEGRRRTRDSDYFLPEDVRIAVRTRQFDQASLLVDKCRATGREWIAITCVEAVLDVDWEKLTEAQQANVRLLADYGSAGDPYAKPGALESFFGKAGALTKPTARPR